MGYEKRIDNLMDDAKELVTKLRDTKNPDVQRLRDRVDGFISRGAERKPPRDVQRSMKITRIPSSILEYVHDHPWLAVLTAASLAWTLSHVSAASRGSRAKA